MSRRSRIGTFLWMTAERTWKEQAARALSSLGRAAGRWRRIMKSMGPVLLGKDTTLGLTLHPRLPSGAGEGSVPMLPIPAEGLHFCVVPPMGASGPLPQRR